MFAETELELSVGYSIRERLGNMGWNHLDLHGRCRTPLSKLEEPDLFLSFWSLSAAPCSASVCVSPGNFPMGFDMDHLQA